jgi:tetratricopeptide (TPR) repeat protein
MNPIVFLISAVSFILSSCSKKEEPVVEGPPRFEEDIANHLNEHPGAILYLQLRNAGVKNAEIPDRNGNGKVDEDELIATAKDLYQKDPGNRRYEEIVKNTFKAAAEYHFRKARDLFNGKECSSLVIQEYQKALEYDIDHPEANFIAGACSQDPVHYQRILKNNPQDREAHIALILTLGNRGNYSEATQSLEEYIRLFPDADPVGNYNLLGHFNEKQNKTEEAVRAYEKAVGLDSTDAVSHKNLGTALWTKGDATLAKKELLKALVLDPKLKPEIQEILSKIGKARNK